MATAQIRTLKRKSDGAIKRMDAGPAARFVSKNMYEYVDGLEDESAIIKEKDKGRITTFEKQDSEILKTDNITVRDAEPAPEQARKFRQPRTIKRTEIPQARMNQILATATFPSEATVSPEKDVDALKRLIEKAKRKRQN